MYGTFEPSNLEGLMQSQWNEDYDKLLERAITEGKVQLLPDKEERRDHPRFKLSEDWVRSTETSQRDIINLSKTGYAFHSERKYEIGEEVPLSLREAFVAHAKVVGCEMVESDASFLEFKYVVRCRFTSQEHGMIILLLLFEDSTLTGKMEP